MPAAVDPVATNHNYFDLVIYVLHDGEQTLGLSSRSRSSEVALTRL